MKYSYTKPLDFCWALLILSVAIGIHAQTSKSKLCPQRPGPGGIPRAINITETELDGAIASFHWLGKDGKVLLAFTSASTVYKSIDDGQSWQNQLPLMDGSESTSPRGIRAIYTTQDHDVTYYLGSQSRLWRSQSRLGNRYTAISLPYPITKLTVHPVRSDWLLGESLTAHCYDTTATGYCYRQLTRSLDSGATWQVIATYVPNSQYSWGNAGKHGIPETNVWVMEYEDKDGNQGSGSSVYILKHSIDWFQNTIVHNELKNILFFLYSNNNVYLAQRSSDQIGGLHLIVSTDQGKTFRRALFPFGDLKENQYSILDDSEGAVFMSVQHGGPAWGHLYNSDSLGSEYDLSLHWLSRDSNGNSAFRKMGGLAGIYLANQRQGVIGNNAGTGERTLITFDKGAQWMQLALPYYFNGSQVACEFTGCQLNLHGTHKASSGGRNEGAYGPVHSSRNAVGIVLATGNVGDILNRDIDSTNTYISTDAGWTWYEIAQGSHTYEYTDHGGLILMADNVRNTNKVKFSWNMGRSFDECEFTDSAMKVLNIISEPSSTAKGFVLHGTRSSQGATRGIIAHIDFENALPKPCKDNDYETWSPYDSHDDPADWKCLMGETVGYKRRKATSECWNGNEYEQKTEPKPCPCAKEDYDCDLCYQRMGLDGCSHIANCEEDPSHNPPEDCPLGYYNVSMGYRLVPGTKCFISADQGLNLLPKRIPCQKNSDSEKDPNKSGNKGKISPGIVVLIVFIVVGVVAGALAVLLYRNRDNERLRNFISSLPLPGGGGQSSVKFAPLHNDSDSLGIEEIHSTHRTRSLSDGDLEEAQPLDDRELDQTIQSNLNK